ncbi:MAG TPA: biopolymer transporter ExbD [Kofleriaceae bacterium]|nr:biopolymer transporter ExbD [Kofleriaceae bacterium]
MAGAGAYHDEDPSGQAITDINVTPLVDVVLVLLIIFMVTTELIHKYDRGITMERPKTVSGNPVKTKLSITIDRDRVVRIGKTIYSDLALAQADIEREVLDNPDIKAVISADVTVPHGDVMRVIDIVKDAGVTKFALGSDPLLPEGPGPR